MGRRPTRRIIWLIVEGETELYYLTGLRNDPARPKPNPPVKINIKCAGGRSPEHVVAKAKDHSRIQGRDARNQEFYCVFDVEDDEPGKRRTLEKALVEAARNNFGVVLSNPCFELWLHCHVDDLRARTFASCDVCLAGLRRAWTNRRVSRHGYEKGDDRIYDKLKRWLNDAIETARELREVHHGTVARTADANASTDVYGLVQYLQGLTANYQPYGGSGG